MIRLFLVAFLTVKAIGSPTAAQDRIPTSWNTHDLAESCFFGTEKETVKVHDAKAYILVWQIEEDTRPVRPESCIAVVNATKADGQQFWRLIHIYRDGNRGWIEVSVTDVPFTGHTDFASPPSNIQVYQFCKDTWWRFAPEHNFVLVDAEVCEHNWKQLTGEAPTQFYSPTQVLFFGKGDLESAPHGSGNVYAPDVHFENKTYRMWYGGQGKDGHDRILYAESDDGLQWTRRGVAVQDPTANHVNDPSVVHVDGTYYMFFTRARRDVVDEIALATSTDGLKWTMRGTVLKPGLDGGWDLLSIGRPAVLYENGTFKMWYDGRKDLPLGAPPTGVPKSSTSARSVGYATSRDGIHWTKHKANPVMVHDCGGIDVKRIGDHYVMLSESQRGTLLATSPDGIAWTYHGAWVSKTDNAFEAFGNVTPCLFVPPDGTAPLLYFGAAANASWDHNSIAMRRLSAPKLAALGFVSRK